MLHDFNAAYLNECAGIYHSMFTSGEWNFNWLTIENTKRYFNDLCGAPRFKGFIYLVDNKLTGACFGDVSDYFSTAQYTIKEIFIDQHVQGKGLGSAFLADIENNLRDNGINNIILSTSRGIKAFDFYKKNGFIENPDTVFLVKFLK